VYRTDCLVCDRNLESFLLYFDMRAAEHTDTIHGLTRVLQAPRAGELVGLAVSTNERNGVDCAYGLHVLLSFYLVCYLHSTGGIGSMQARQTLFR